MIEKLKALLQWWVLLERSEHNHWCELNKGGGDYPYNDGRCADPACRVGEGSGQAFQHRSSGGQTDRFGSSDVDHAPGGADPRRHGVLEGDAAGALLP
ncbi:hypothetical protein AXF24_12665 [Streptococcus pneumoniae]|nr:hypothetical protein AWW74_12680 [Streptococcus pneumoniae]KXB94696.1 hypothetical protein AXF24_12665 [Streptococcus pneumoniae]